MSAIPVASPHHSSPLAMEVIGLRTMPGQACSHVVGVLHKPSFCSCNVQSITGQSMMFWFDQVVLVGVIGLVSMQLSTVSVHQSKRLNMDYMIYRRMILDLEWFV